MPVVMKSQAGRPQRNRPAAADTANKPDRTTRERMTHLGPLGGATGNESAIAVPRASAALIARARFAAARVRNALPSLGAALP